MKPNHGLIRWATGLAILAGAAGAALALAGIDTPARAPLVLVFLLAVPGLAVASLLDGLDAAARAVIAGTAAVVVDAVVAEVMIASGTWSPRTGVVAVALVSVVIVAARALAARMPRHARLAAAEPGSGQGARSGGPDSAASQT